MKKNIFFKTFWPWASLLFAVIAMLTAFFFNISKDWHHKSFIRELNRVSSAISAQVTDSALKYPLQLDREIKALGKKLDLRLTVIAPNGRVIADSEADPAIMDNHKNRPEISRALTGQAAHRIRFSSTLMSDMFYLATPLTRHDKLLGVLRLSVHSNAVRRLRSRLEVRIIALSIVFLTLSFIIAFVISRSISTPIRKLANAARTVTSGNFNARIYLRDRGELGDLADNFNRMISRQDQLFQEISRNRKRLESMFSAMQEGLVMIDSQGTVVMANRSFKEIIRNSAPENKFYWEAFRSSDLFELIRNFLDADNPPPAASGEILLEDRSFLVSLTRLSSENAFIITLHDVSQQRQLEKIKRDFVGNVSHELKTPLTSIKGFVEVLDSHVSTEGRRYLEIINRNAERMIHIISDLLLLSKMEADHYHLDMDTVSFPDLVTGISALFEKNLREKSLDLDIVMAEDLKTIKGDYARLEDLFINLIDNAIKYTERGKITVSARNSAEGVVCQVRDTGIGIPAKHLDRIFERFYVVDPSRSRETGGTGLGLSIAKHIVMLHRGTISVQSKPGAGTVFTLFFPQYSNKT